MMKKVSESELKKLLNTGWQSWSYSSPFTNFIKFPPLNYPPKKIKGFSHLNLEYESNLKPPAKGWCSWYAYGGRINRDLIMKQTMWFAEHKEVPIEYILVDGGWCREGDWLNENTRKFPGGMGVLSSDIKKLGFKPGLWISPFQASPRSRIVKEHPEWFVKKDGKFIDCLQLTPFDQHLFYKKYLIDITNPDVRSYLYSVMDRLLGEYGYELIKMDFLYAIYFHPELSIEDADLYLRDFLTYVSEKYPNVYTIGCGCPLVPAIGVVDSMRVGPDILLSPFLQFSSRAKSLDMFIHKKVLKIVNNRVFTKKYWNIDADAFVCRPTLSHTRRMIKDNMKLIKDSGGNIFLGDDFTKLSSKRIQKYVLPLFD
ncbi:MAG TPA: alpha-galactosidase [Candidatus Dojkabacteria bacterium]|nr:alpha-galactosidase [Candidatus Dojkabacteria bacterium]